MKIGIVGLGLIGASLAKAIKLKTSHVVFGYDRDNNINIKAKITRVIDDILTGDILSHCDVVFLALYPRDAAYYLADHAKLINTDCIVLDCGGTKQFICDEGFRLARENGFTFIGSHPMAGGGKSGFDNSKPKLFDGASVILAVPPQAPIFALEKIRKLFTQIGFGNIEMSTPLEHDRIIAYTSQLACITSSAFIKSQTASEHYGFSDDSYDRMTADAIFDEKKWTELFFENRDFLSLEIDGLTERLGEYSRALREGDKQAMLQLLKEGRERKEYIDNKNKFLIK